MIGNFEESLALVLKHEGGWVDDPHDPGGETNMGVTIGTWEDWVGHKVVPGSLKSLTVKDIAPLYKVKYWDKVKGDQLPNGVDYAVFDYAVLAGPSRATKTLQSCAGVNADGIIGPKTLAAVNSKNPVDLSRCICDNRLAFLKSLPTWPRYGKGWSRRIADVRLTAARMSA